MWGSAWLSSCCAAGADLEPSPRSDVHQRRAVRAGEDVQHECLEREAGLRVHGDRLGGFEDARQDLDDAGEIQILGPSLKGGAVGLPDRQLRSARGEAGGIANEGRPCTERDQRLLADFGAALGAGRHCDGDRGRRSKRTLRAPAPRRDESIERIELRLERTRLGGETQRPPGAPGRQGGSGGGVVLADTMDSLEPGPDQPRGHRAEDNRLASRAHRLRQLLRVCGGQQQVGTRRRLLERLEHVVGRLLGEAVGPRDHRDAPPARIG